MKKFLLALLAITLVSSANASFYDTIKGSISKTSASPEPKFVALYFSAHWCPPCRMFTPKLVEWYKTFKQAHPEFELVFVSSDRDEAAMNAYIKETSMPWPHATFDNSKNPLFTKYASEGIPYLVLVGEDGKALTALPGNEWQSPMEVLGKIEKLVGNK